MLALLASSIETKNYFSIPPDYIRQVFKITDMEASQGKMSDRRVTSFITSAIKIATSMKQGVKTIVELMRLDQELYLNMQ